MHSHLPIEAGEQFMLGGGQPGRFVMAGQHNEPVAVEVPERPAQGSAVWRVRLAPGQRARLSFGLGSLALLRNASPRQAGLDVDVLNGQGLTMTYEPVAKK